MNNITNLKSVAINSPCSKSKRARLDVSPKKNEKCLVQVAPFLAPEMLRVIMLVSKRWKAMASDLIFQRKDFVLSPLDLEARSYLPSHIFSIIFSQSPLSPYNNRRVCEDFYLMFMGKDTGMSNPYWILMSKDLYSPSTKQVGSKPVIKRLNTNSQGYGINVISRAPTKLETVKAMEICKKTLGKNLYGDGITSTSEPHEFIGQSPDGGLYFVGSYHKHHRHGAAVVIDPSTPLISTSATRSILTCRKRLQF